MSQTVLVVEPNSSGHRFSYVRIIVDSALRRGMKLVLATSLPALESDEFKLHLSEIQERITTMQIADKSALTVERLSLDIGADITVVPDGDYFAAEIGRRRKWLGGQLSVLIMRSTPQRHRVAGIGTARMVVKKALLRSAGGISGVRIFTLKSATSPTLRSNSDLLDPVSIATDQSQVRLARALLPGGDGIYWLAVLGAISARKNVPMIAEAISSTGIQHFGLIVAGRIDERDESEVLKALTALSSSGNSVATYNRLLTDAELDSFVGAADCVILAHSNEGPSGLMGKAAAQGTRIIAAGARSLRKDARSIPDVATWVPLSRSRLATAITKSALLPKPAAVDRADPDSFGSALIGASEEQVQEG
jgi:hypothetical protein